MNMLHAMLGFTLATMPLPAETLTNDIVVALTAAGLGDEAIIAKIRSSEVAFDLTAEKMILLRQRGVSGPVIAAMLAASGAESPAAAMSVDSPDPMRPHPAGLYLLSGDGAAARMARIEATVSNQAKTGGLFGYAFTGGIASMSIKASIQNESARTVASGPKPSFYFFFDESNGGAAPAWAAGTAAAVTSPAEFTLIRLNRKKGRREARVGSANIAGAKTGVMDKDRIPFDYRLVRPGVYEAAPTVALAPGEYGFIYAIAGGGAGGAMTARIFDFSVR